MPDTPLLDPAAVNPSSKAQARDASAQRTPHIIVIGNEKGGAGKSTMAIHLSIALSRMGWHVGVLDLDLRQRSLSRYLSNRVNWQAETGNQLPMPEIIRLDPSPARDLDRAEEEEAAILQETLQKLQSCQFIIVDTPGGNTFLSRQVHIMADTLITPLNDSFIDFDLLGEVHPKTLKVIRPSFYSELVWDCRKIKATRSRSQIDWVVMRNRMSMLGTRNRQRVGRALEELSDRIGFRIAPGMSERIIFRELFPSGLTLLDMNEGNSRIKFTLSHVAARQELRDLMIVLKLPGLEGRQFDF